MMPAAATSSVAAMPVDCARRRCGTPAAKRSSNTKGCSRWRLPRRSPSGACRSATSGCSGGTATSFSPVNGQRTSPYSGCSRRMSVPFTPRTGRNGSPSSAARSWLSEGGAAALADLDRRRSARPRRKAGARPEILLEADVALLADPRPRRRRRAGRRRCRAPSRRGAGPAGPGGSSRGPAPSAAARRARRRGRPCPVGTSAAASSSERRLVGVRGGTPSALLLRGHRRRRR